KKGPEVSKRFGLAWAGGKTKWGVLPVPSKVQPGSAHGIFKRFPKEITLVDEHYWGLGGNTHQITVLATSQAATVNGSKGPPKRGQWDGVEWPLFWTNELGEGRVFCSIPGHNLFTFNDPFFRIILLRGMAWAMREPFDPFIPIVTHNALLK
ncbi:MAG TPA: ThuA domain-containing protein, partial [Verrucomicrobiales bacterium]|nr:ThuA domain-containing protein [Verrucomicrobiales bacterium]